MEIIVKLFTSSEGFPAVKYNMEKVAKGDAALLLYKNFGIIHAFARPITSDFEHYLGAVASLSRKSHYAQFHAVLSVKGKSASDSDLKIFAESWLNEMGYSKQPYMLFFHSDTKNNHIHIVSTSITLTGKKISDSFDRVRAINAVNNLLGIDIRQIFKTDISPLLSYRFSSTAQLSGLLRLKGYRSFINANEFTVRKYGITLLKIQEAKISKLIDTSLSRGIVEQARLAINLALKSKDNHCRAVYQPLAHNFAQRVLGFRSELSEHLFSKDDLEIIYHFKRTSITGFTAIDHRSRSVIDGSQIMQLDRLIGRKTPGTEQLKAYSR